MTEENDNTDNGTKESVSANSEERRRELSEALAEGLMQKSGEATDGDDRPRTVDYEDGYIPTRFRSESRSTGERRARETNDSSDE